MRRYTGMSWETRVRPARILEFRFMQGVLDDPYGTDVSPT